MENIKKVNIISGKQGVLDGNGELWWGQLISRPRILHIYKSFDVFVDRIFFKNSAYWTFFAENSDGLEISNCIVEARRAGSVGNKHSVYDLTAFETDGFDVTGRNVYIHDCNIWNQDDCISVKDDSQNMRFERIICSGLGLAIGSIGSSIVRNISFVNCQLIDTIKGIYIKTRYRSEPPIGFDASITNILYENITISNPAQFAIWIGTAQQTGQPCSFLFPFSDECKMSGYQTIENITLRNIIITDPLNLITAVLLGNSSNPLRNILFDNVIIYSSTTKITQSLYYCNNFLGYAVGDTFPIPCCFYYYPIFTQLSASSGWMKPTCTTVRKNNRLFFFNFNSDLFVIIFSVILSILICAAALLLYILLIPVEEF
jgi:polygalacturonase